MVFAILLIIITGRVKTIAICSGLAIHEDVYYV